MILACIQARMNSTRLAGKILLPLAGQPLLWHVVTRLKHCHELDRILIATSLENSDDPVEAFALKNQFEYYRGSETDVLDRFYQAAKLYKPDGIVRITADCPLLDPEIVDRVIREFRGAQADYVSNVLMYTFPDGLDVEVFSFEALEKTWRQAHEPSEREHVTPFMRRSEQFRTLNVENSSNESKQLLRWTVDYPEDLEFVRKVYEALYREGRIFHMRDILHFLEENPDLKRACSQGAVLNEGYYKSLIRDWEHRPLESRFRPLCRSQELKKRAEKIIPSCTQTFSKGPSQFIQGVSPVFLERAKGVRVWDVDGNEYLDCAMALGSIILGHANSWVNEAVKKQLDNGISLSLPHSLEIELSELLVEIIPCAEMVRFGKNGSDVTSAAVRVARAFTGRDKIVCSGYHGWQDWFIGTTTRDKGIPAAVKSLTFPFVFNDLSSLENIFRENQGEVAAVIMEPVSVTEPLSGFLEKVKELAHREGAILIFDEVVSGFRFSLGGAQEYFNVVPDLACFGKSMANGLPLSAIVGKREIMALFDEVFFSFTFGGETAALRAALGVIQELKQKKVIAQLWEQGRKLRDGYNVLAREMGLSAITDCVGYPPRHIVRFFDGSGKDSLLLKSYFQQECIKRGVLFTGAHNMCFDHTEDIVEQILHVYYEALTALKNALAQKQVEAMLEGELLQPVFRQT